MGKTFKMHGGYETLTQG